MPSNHLIVASNCGINLQFKQFSHSVMSNSLWPRGLKHTRPPCPSATPRVYSNPCPLSWWCHPTFSSSVIPFSACPQSFPASGSFPIIEIHTIHIVWPKFWSFSFSINPFSEYSRRISFRIPTNCGKFLEMGIPDHLIYLLRNLYAGVKKQQLEPDMVQLTGSKLGKELHQGCILSPCLFNLYAEYIMWNAGLDESQAGIEIARRNINFT